MRNSTVVELKTDRLGMYRSRADKSLSWLTSHMQSFSPIRNSDLCMDGLKVYSEVTLLYAYLKNWQHLGFDAGITTWQSALEGHLQNKLFAEMIRRKPEVSYAFMFPYLLLRSTGFQSDYYDTSYDYMVRWGHYESIELVPFRQFDFEFFLWKAGLQEEPDWTGHYQATVLGRCKSPLTLDKDAAYSITHTLFYLTDFGNRLLSLPFPEQKRVTDIVEALLLHYWRVGHYDLMGELLINLNCLNKDDTYLYQSALHAFLQAWNDDGSVPAFRNQKSKKEPGDFSFCYHTTLVGVFLCAVEMNKMIKRERL